MSEIKDILEKAKKALLTRRKTFKTVGLCNLVNHMTKNEIALYINYLHLELFPKHPKAYNFEGNKSLLGVYSFHPTDFDVREKWLDEHIQLN